jgi:hypothetical protein
VDMTQVVYNQYSPYYQTQQVNNYVSYLDFWNGQYILPNSNDTLYEIEYTYQHRPDLLSYQFYNTSQLWWVFALRNPNSLQDPVWDFVAGLTIYVPAKASLIKVS